MGVTPERYASFYAMQQGLCAVCGQPAVDYDICGVRNRGQLCTSCNDGLGRFKDNPNLLRAAADYLDEWKKRLRRNPASLPDEPVVPARA